MKLVPETLSFNACDGASGLPAVEIPRSRGDSTLGLVPFRPIKVTGQSRRVGRVCPQRAGPRSRKYGGALRTDAPYPPLLLRHYPSSYLHPSPQTKLTMECEGQPLQNAKSGCLAAIPNAPSRPSPATQRHPPFRPWTTKELAMIGTTSDCKVARRTDRSLSAVRGKKFALRAHRK